MKLSPEQARYVAEHYLKQGDAPTAITALRIASDMGDPLSTLFLSTFVRDDTVATDAAVAKAAPIAHECWYDALDREYKETPPKRVPARELKRLLSAFAAMTATTAKESA